MLSTRRADNPGVAEDEMRGVGVAGSGPSGGFRTVLLDCLEHCSAIDAIEGIFKVQKEDPLVLHVDAVVVEDGVGCMNDGLGAALDANPDLMRREVVVCVGGGLSGDTLGRPPPNSIADGDWTMAA